MKKEVLLISVLIVSGILGFALFKIIPQHYFGLYPAIPLYFLFLAIVTIIMLYTTKTISENRTMTLYMGLKTVKLFISIALVLLYLKKADTQNVAFTITFISFYFIYLGSETVYFLKFLESKKTLRQKKNE